MALISLTRLRLASWRFLPGFVWHTFRSALQARRAPGFQGMRLLADRRLTFWTATAWDGLGSLKAYRSAGAHRAAMGKLAGWCDEARVTRWAGAPESMRDWAAAHSHMAASGEASHMKRPSAGHLSGHLPLPRLRPPVELVVPARRTGRSVSGR